MKVLPQASAIGAIHSGTMAGKLNGVIPAHHAQRLAQRETVDAAPDLIGEVALQQIRDAGGEFHHLHAARDLATGVRQHLAVLGRDDGRQLAGVLLQQVAELEHHACASQRGQAGPTGQRRRGSRDRGIDIRARAEHHLARHLARRRIEHIRKAAGATGGAGAADDVMNDRIHAHVSSGAVRGDFRPGHGRARHGYRRQADATLGRRRCVDRMKASHHLLASLRHGDAGGQPVP